MTDIKFRGDINLLVEAFYQKAITDPTIGHIFTEVAHLNLATHLPVICDFWESILLGNMIYRGNPMLKHLELAEKTALTQVHFTVWLGLWEETVRGLHSGEKADLAVKRAQDIGRLMLYKIGQAAE
jgi:hemoglobin